MTPPAACPHIGRTETAATATPRRGRSGRARSRAGRIPLDSEVPRARARLTQKTQVARTKPAVLFGNALIGSNMGYLRRDRKPDAPPGFMEPKRAARFVSSVI